MRVSRTGIFISEAPSAKKLGYTRAVSMHAHTDHSKEQIGFVPDWLAKIPILYQFYKKEKRRYLSRSGRELDIGQGYWIHPDTPSAVYETEKRSIEEVLEAEALVSLTDHDDTSAARSLRKEGAGGVPISLEWTVPVGEITLHMGIHNLPAAQSEDIFRELRTFSLRPDRSRLGDILGWLNEYPEILIVLNHPFARQKTCTSEDLRRWLRDILHSYGNRVHALEVNGYRPWDQNALALALAHEFGLPVVSGGDRHATAVNSLLNLTNAATFSEFVEEVRKDAVSHLIVLPCYRESTWKRLLEALGDFFRYYPEYPPGRRDWTDRVFLQLEEGVIRPLSWYWRSRVPLWARSAMWLIRLFASMKFPRTLGGLYPHKNRSEKLGAALKGKKGRSGITFVGKSPLTF